MESILVLDFGGQYNQLIARRVREANVYCEVKPCTISLDEITAGNYMGIIFTGGPASVYADGAPRVDPGVFSLGLPILGICYGAQLTAFTLGGKVSSGATALTREYGKT
ncbi:MAG TPA: GMP synthase (glutamine-hydrolyzing), partial [Methanocorpusculum sp.]|nr:GMP synthase (glutamine-hydrolyzing) [Methanocorpusculum sp.]